MFLHSKCFCCLKICQTFISVQLISIVLMALYILLLLNFVMSISKFIMFHLQKRNSGATIPEKNELS